MNISCMILSSFTLLALSVVAGTVRADEELTRIRDAAKIAAEKLESDVTLGITASRKQEPTAARASLELLLARVQNATDGTETQRSRLTQQLRRRLSEVDAMVRELRAAAEAKPAPRSAERPRDPVADSPRPSTSSVAKQFQDGAKGGLNVANATQQERSRNIVAIQGGIERSAIPTDKEITFPKNWLALSKSRKDLVNPQLTAKEIALLKTLNSVMSVDYEGDRFRKVINHIQDRTGLSIIIDDASMKDANIDYDDPVSFKVNKVTVRTVLKKILGDKGLTYVIKEGMIQVMTPKKASEMVVIRSYPVEDLVTPSMATQMWGPFVNQAIMNQNAQQLIALIQSSTDPTYWQPNGPGSITFHPATRTIIVRASAELQYQLASPGMFGR